MKKWRLSYNLTKMRPLNHDFGANDGNGFRRVEGPRLSDLNKNIIVSTASIDFIF